jgi:hypothetical protein
MLHNLRGGIRHVVSGYLGCDLVTDTLEQKETCTEEARDLQQILSHL